MPGTRAATPTLALRRESADASCARSTARMNGNEVTSILTRPRFTVAALNLRSPAACIDDESVGDLWP